MKSQRQVGHGDQKRANDNQGDELVRQKGKLLPSIWSRKSVKAGPSTPVHPWRVIDNNDYFSTFVILHAPSASSPAAQKNPSSSSPVSARKLAAAVWEFEFFAPQGGKMHRSGGVNGCSVSQGHGRMRRGQTGKDKEVENPGDAELTFPDQPETASSLKRHIAAALMQHHRSMDKRGHSKQPLSPASYSSSMEMTRYNPIMAPSPTSSLEFKGRMGESSYSLKTSTELLKVLNRIWSLEEQHASSVSLMKGLKMELHNARAKIKELVRDRQADRREIDELMKQISEDGVIRKSKEQDRVSTALQSTRDELENEKQLRKRSESLHRKLAREMVETKTSFSAAMEEIEREKTSRVLLEGLCDEFAEGIKNYELELHSLRLKLPEKERRNGADRDRLILHVSEAWIDERMQMKMREAETGSAEKYSVVDKLRPEVEKFLQSRRSRHSGVNGQKLNRKSRESRLRRSSMESVPMNDVVSGPHNTGDEDSVDSNIQCFELNKPGNDNDQGKGFPVDECLASSSNTKLVSCERIKSLNPSGLQVKFDEQMSWDVSNDDNECQTQDAEKQNENADNERSRGIGTSQKPEICEAAEDESLAKHSHKNYASSNYTIEHLIRNQHLISEGGSMHLQKDSGETSSSYRKRASPVRQWMSKLVPCDLSTAESSTKYAPTSRIKENTLKAKLIEARMKGNRPRSRGPLGL